MKLTSLSRRIGAAAALMAVLALPAQGQSVLDNTARTVTGLTAPLLTDTGDRDLTRDLHIEAFNWTATVGVGAAFRCPGDKSVQRPAGSWVKDPEKVTRLNPEGWVWQRRDPIKPAVSYHIEDATWSHGDPIARACKIYTDGRLRPITSGGRFTLRVWGKVCLDGQSNVRPSCLQYKPGTALAPSAAWLGVLRHAGYKATFRPGPNCGPATWPSPDMQERFPTQGYAQWCDFTVVVP